MNPSLGLVSHTGASKTAINGLICSIYMFLFSKALEKVFLVQKSRVHNRGEQSDEAKQAKLGELRGNARREGSVSDGG